VHGERQRGHQEDRLDRRTTDTTILSQQTGDERAERALE